MRIQSFFCTPVVPLCLALLLPRWVGATTVVPPTFDELADQADLVFVGRAMSSRAEWRNAGDSRAIFTFVTFETEEVLKGMAAETVTLQFLGGTIGGVTLDVSGVPAFATHERVILFVQKNGTQFCPLVGVFHGKFRLQRDARTGREVMLKHDGNPLRDLAEIGAGEGAELVPGRTKVFIPAQREPLSVDEFKSKLREHLNRRAGEE